MIESTAVISLKLENLDDKYFEQIKKTKFEVSI